MKLKKQLINLLIVLFTLPFIGCEKQLPAVEDLPERPDLPDPFVMLDGTRIETAADWYSKRRPELKKLFQHYVYGYLPPKPRMQFETVKTDPGLFNGQATYKEIIIHMYLPAGEEVNIHLALFVPNQRDSAAAVFVALNKCGNHTLLDYDGITIAEREWLHQGCQDEEQQRGSKTDVWAVENTIKHGYALATFAVADIDPDKNDFTDGVHAKYKDAPGDSLSRWATIAAWAWGLHRVVDYLETDPDIDRQRICLTGWSRRGKTALFATAMDERIALVVPHQSGTGGMALSRMNPSETVERITTSVPHWFNGNFKKFGKDVNKLPVDQHLLIALVAPRPLMDDAGLKDTWASPQLALQAMKAATPVYEFLGEKGIVGTGIARDTLANVTMGRLLQFQRNTKHQLDVHYWNAMFDFADYQFSHPIDRRE
jgi:hypothetical protein